MAEPSNPNPEKLFQFTINSPLIKFRSAINALIDDKFNAIANGVIEVFEGGVDFTVRHNISEVTGLLRLKSTALKDFYFNERCKGKRMRINFRILYKKISDTDDWVTFTHFDGSNEIIVNLGDNQVKEFNVGIFCTLPEIERIFGTEYICEAEIPSDSLREILDQVELLRKAKRRELVVVDISEKIVRFIIGEGNHPPPRFFNFNDVNQVGGTRGVEPGKDHQARFNWHGLEVLKTASEIGPTSVISFVIKPKYMIMTRFSLGDLGDLEFIDEAVTLIINAHLVDSYN